MKEPVSLCRNMARPEVRPLLSFQPDAAGPLAKVSSAGRRPSAPEAAGGCYARSGRRREDVALPVAGLGADGLAGSSRRPHRTHFGHSSRHGDAVGRLGNRLGDLFSPGHRRPFLARASLQNRTSRRSYTALRPFGCQPVLRRPFDAMTAAVDAAQPTEGAAP